MLHMSLAKSFDDKLSTVANCQKFSVLHVCPIYLRFSCLLLCAKSQGTERAAAILLLSSGCYSNHFQGILDHLIVILRSLQKFTGENANKKSCSLRTMMNKKSLHKQGQKLHECHIKLWKDKLHFEDATSGRRLTLFAFL